MLVVLQRPNVVFVMLWGLLFLLSLPSQVWRDAMTFWPVPRGTEQRLVARQPESGEIEQTPGNDATL